MVQMGTPQTGSPELATSEFVTAVEDDRVTM
jgi:hypothetical protein